MTRAFKTAAAITLVALCAAAAASAAGDETGRYSMSPADGGFVRLDRQTGAMTFCTKADATWACTAMADAQASANTEIDRLEGENKSLKSDKRHLEEMLGMADPSKPGSAAPETGSTPPPMKIPSEQDVDQAFDYLEGMVKKFRERMKKLEEGTNKDQQL